MTLDQATKLAQKQADDFGVPVIVVSDDLSEDAGGFECCAELTPPPPGGVRGRGRRGGAWVGLREFGITLGQKKTAAPEGAAAIGTIWWAASTAGPSTRRQRRSPPVQSCFK